MSYFAGIYGISSPHHPFRFYLLDGQILPRKKLVDLSPEAIELFHSTIRKQMRMNYNRTDFERYLIGLFQFDAQELFEMGKIFERQPLKDADKKL